ncbi:endolytic transglycosylase MltG [Polyangium sorediatum]|uniref:Endolytic murein transglycosylase n=1 Tax=Polyangium sorediatum TaxID=889274 RepID=A0ABT6PAN5_9BACT|nr:endolytic transglycosylase MltG [Polyangium sorediatum]MDI1437698.1 endolytic transglycosylase MltG [Polyangium sorediatum]
MPTRAPSSPGRRRRRASPPAPSEAGAPAPSSLPPSPKKPRAPRTPRARLSPRGRAALFAIAGAVSTVGLALLALVLGYGHLHAPDAGTTVELDWPAGLDSDEAAALLARHDLVRNEGAMAMFLRTTGGTGAFVPGPHLLPQGLDPWDLRHLLERSSKRPTTRVTIPEGYHRFDIATRLEKLRVAGKNAFLRASADPLLLDELGIERKGALGVESAEGYLFPATYDFPLDTDPKEIVRRLVTEADRRWAALATQHAAGFASLRNTLGYGRREILILASIVEKEAVQADERPLIASVFLNRLLDPTFKPKRLQSDPTASYACFSEPDVVPACAGFTGKITPAINRDAKNRYSTYVNDGLPPGPIANPGAPSIEAVLAPSATKYLYFVAKGGGRHTFSEALDQHNEAVRKLRATSPSAERPE